MNVYSVIQDVDSLVLDLAGIVIGSYELLVRTVVVLKLLTSSFLPLVDCNLWVPRLIYFMNVAYRISGGEELLGGIYFLGFYSVMS